MHVSPLTDLAMTACIGSVACAVVETPLVIAMFSAYAMVTEIAITASHGSPNVATRAIAHNIAHLWSMDSKPMRCGQSRVRLAPRTPRGTDLAA